MAVLQPFTVRKIETVQQNGWLIKILRNTAFSSWGYEVNIQ